MGSLACYSLGDNDTEGIWSSLAFPTATVQMAIILLTVGMIVGRLIFVLIYSCGLRSLLHLTCVMYRARTL